MFTVSESDRVNNKLPEYNQLRMREDEYKYIHLGYDRTALPYYEALYLGVGKSKKEAYIDMIGTTHAYAAINVNCNYNSSSDEWIAIGYRRTDAKGDAIKDIFIYEGKDPPNSFRIAGGYTAKRQGNRLIFSEYKDKNKVAGVEYKLLKHNLKSGSEIISLNMGNGGSDLYLYYTTASFYREKSAESEMAPITNICFTYGDISPRQATSEQLATVFERSYYGTTVFDTSAYQNPVWECVLGISGSPENWNFNAEGGRRISLNEGLVPGINGTDWDAPDSRVYMYVDRSDKKSKYTIRESARLPEFGYYAAESTFGYLKQVG